MHQPSMNLSFAGCGFLGIYHVGVAVCLKRYSPQLLLNKISGASAGAIAACCLLCDLPLGEITSDVLRVVTEARSKTLGPFSPSFNVQNVLLEGLEKVLPEDAHERVSGKLHISLTRVYDGQNVIVSQFNSKEDLLQALQASAFIPFFSGLMPPRFHGVRYMDGGFSNNLPVLDDGTVTVSPFCGESDICPRDETCQILHVSCSPPCQHALLSSCFIPIFSGWIPPRFHGVRYIDGCYSDNLPILDEGTVTVSPFCGESDICPRDDTYNVLQVNLANTSIELSRENVYRFARILFPPSPEVLSEMCKQGFDDALRFLHRNNMINCTRCLAVQSTFTVSQVLDENFDYDPHCHECKMQRQESLVAELPNTVMNIFQDAIETANKGLVNWVFKHRGMKLLTVLSMPYVLPADLAYATFTNLPSYRRRGWRLSVSVGGGEGRKQVERKNRWARSIRRCAHSERVTRFQEEAAYHYWRKPERFLVNAPHLGKNLRQFGQFLIENLSHLMSHMKQQHEQLSAKISCHLAITEYRGTKYDMEAMDTLKDVPSPKHNQMNFNFTLNLQEQEMPKDQTSAIKFQNKMFGQASRRSSSLSISNSQSDGASSLVDEDTFDHILQVTQHNDALMAFYYLDENNKVKVTEIFDVTEADTEALLCPDEREANVNLEFDDHEWNVPLSRSDSWNGLLKLENEQCEDDRVSLAGSDVSLQESLDPSANVFSDAESEWINTKPSSPPLEKLCPDSRPESDQPATKNKRRASETSPLAAI